MSDEELVGEALDGRAAAFNELSGRHREHVDRICRRFFRDPEIASDLAQECFTRAFTRLSSYRAEMPFVGWLRTIAINACYDELRRRRRHPEELVGDFSAAEVAWIHLVNEVSPEQIVAEAEQRREAYDLAHRLLATLKPEDRMVLTMKDSEDLSVSEIAQHLGWSEAKVKIRAFRARRVLRKQAEHLLKLGRRTLPFSDS